MNRHLHKVLFLCLLGLLSAEVYAQQNRPLAIVRKFKPDVIVQNQDVNKRVVLDLTENKGEQLFSGDTLSTREAGFALVVFMDESIAKVKPNSFLILHGEVGTTSKSIHTRISLEEGEIFLDIESQGVNNFEVATSRALASVKGTSFGSKSNGFFWVGKGQVDVTALSSGQTISLFEKMFAQVDADGSTIESGVLTDDELDGLGDGYDEVENDLIQKEIILRFRDQNGQIREVRIDAFDKQQQ